MLRPRELVPREHDARGAQLGAQQVAAGVGNVGVLDAEEQRNLAFEIGEEVERVRAVGRRGRGGVGGGVRA